MPFDGETGFGRRGLHHLDGFRHDLEADVVAEQNSNFQSPVLSKRMYFNTYRPHGEERCAAARLEPWAPT
jgi:hypothetical protein